LETAAKHVRRILSVRILMVNSMKPCAENSASGIFVARQMASLVELGVEVREFYLDDRTSFIGIVRNIRRLKMAIDEWHPNVVHAQYGSITSLITVAASHAPVVISFCGSDLYGSPTISWLRSWVGVLFSQISALLASSVICKSEGLKNKLWRSLDVQVIPNGVDLRRFRPIAKEDARMYLNWASDEQVVLFNAGVNPLTKRLYLAEISVKLARQRLPNLRMEVINNCTPEIVPWLMNASDCLLITSDHEGSPNILKEALACNLPVVSVPCGDVVERLQDVTPSFLVERNPDKIADALVKVLAEGRRSNGREKVEDISQDKIALRIIRLYESLMKD